MQNTVQELYIIFLNLHLWLPQIFTYDDMRKHEKNLNWTKATLQKKLIYIMVSMRRLSQLPLPEESIQGDNYIYSKQNHNDMLDHLCSNMVMSIKIASSEAIPDNTISKHHITGWMASVKEKQSASKDV